MVQLAAFVETFYPVIVPIVIFVAIFWFALGHDKTLLLPFIGSVVLVVALSFAIGIFRIIFISLPSMMVGLTAHLLIAAWLSYAIRRFFKRTPIG
jgi:uncharacterized membrane protein